jgi:hypothetical protein
MPCECWRDVIDETGRLLFVRLREYKHDLKEGHFVEAKLALHAFEERHKIKWTQACVLQFESNVTYSRYK